VAALCERFPLYAEESGADPVDGQRQLQHA
jgi:hypothetical protein